MSDVLITSISQTGGTVTVSGVSNNSPVTVTLSGGTPSPQKVPTNPDGSWTATFTGVPPGTFTVSANEGRGTEITLDSAAVLGFRSPIGTTSLWKLQVTRQDTSIVFQGQIEPQIPSDPQTLPALVCELFQGTLLKTSQGVPAGGQTFYKGISGFDGNSYLAQVRNA